MQITHRFIAEGGRIPGVYGFAWYTPETDHAVCYPIPFNLVLGFLRHWYFRLAHGKNWRTRGHARGVATGRAQGKFEGRQDALMELKAMKILEEAFYKKNGYP